jgi:group I intron endonuclease
MKAFNKHGEESFKFEVIIICFDEDVFKFEEEYIKKYNTLSPNGYNVAEGGKSGRNFLGKTHSEETKQKIGIKSKEYNSRPEVKERSRKVAIKLNERMNSGEIVRHTGKWKKAVEEGRIGNRGAQRTEESKKKISEGLKKFFNTNGSTINREKHSEIMTKANGRIVGQYSKDGTLLNTFASIALASKDTNIPRSTIQSAASGRTRTGGGFIWKYDDKEPKEITQSNN